MKFNYRIFLFILIITPVFVYASIKAMQINGWDDWDFGSAQTMLTIRYWARDGMSNHKFFFIPSGYNSKINFVDEPEFRFLADGTAAGELIGRRLYYTHYPSGYLVPYGLLSKLGFENRFWFRLLAICFSFGAVFFLYGFIYYVTNKKHWPAFIAVFYYITSTIFLRYADSLANQPVDDFLRWSILFFSIFVSQKIIDKNLKNKFYILIWFLYFILAISSYDSTFFIFFWLCALNFYENFCKDKKWYKQIFTKINLKKYFFWALAPILAFIVQILQNTWYLGFKDTLLDFFGVLIFRSTETMGNANSLPFLIKSVVVSLTNIGYFLGMRTRYALPLLIIILLFMYKNKIIAWHSSVWHYVMFLVCSGSLIGFVLPGVGIFGYQGRQMAPALLAIISIATYEIFKKLKEKNFSFKHLILCLLLTFLWFSNFKTTYTYVKQWPNNIVSTTKIDYWNKLNNATDQNTIILTLKDINEMQHGKFIPQFYLDRLTLFFSNTDEALFYMDRIRQSIKKVDFLLVIPKDDLGIVDNFMKENKDYSAQQINIEKDNLINIKIQENEF